MSDARWERVKELLNAALELDPDQRAAFLQNACGDDDALRGEVEMLIVEAERADATFLEPPGLESDSPPVAQPLERQGRPIRLGEFELLDEVGRGGVGVVYRARQSGLDRIVAVKVLEVGLTTSSHAVERFLREARAVAKLHHEGIVPIHAVGQEGNTYWFAMEFIAGGDLAHDLQRQRLDSSPTLPAPGNAGHAHDTAERIRDVARALEAAHAAGIVHRDVKPQNLLIDKAGHLRLVDFGLAKDESQGSISRSGELLGTPYYMSPEQARSRRDAIDHRTDIYSLGTVLYEMLTLRRPFDGDTMQEVLSDILGREPAPVRRYNEHVPRDLELICGKAMSKLIDDRYASAGAFADDLDRFLSFEAIEALPPSLWRRLRRFALRRRSTLIAAAVCAAALTVGFMLSRYQSGRNRALANGAALTSALEIEDWSLHELELQALGRNLSDLEVEPYVPASVREVADQYRNRFDEYVGSLVTRGRALRERGLGRVVDDAGRTRDPVPRDLFLGIDLLSRARALAGDSLDLDDVATPRGAFPMLRLKLDDATVAEAGTEEFIARLIPLDPIGGVPGDPIPLDASNGRANAVAPGWFRVQVEVDGFGLSELTRQFDWGGDLELSVRVEPYEAVRESMVRIGPGRMIPRPGPGPDGFGEGIGCLVAVESAAVDAFWIDEAEVSNGDYLEFVLATGGGAPQLWIDNGFVSSFDDLPLGDQRQRFEDMPVTFVRWVDARAYAEWRGKRLPSHAELEYAHRGPIGLFVPPADAPKPSDDEARINVSGDGVAATRDSKGLLETYLSNALPVREELYRQAPFGLYHALGNVSEMTESESSTDLAGRVRVVENSYLYLGGAWDAQIRQENLASHGLGPMSESSLGWLSIGFRCAATHVRR